MKSTILVLLCLLCAGLPAEEQFKLSSGDGLAFCDNANTHSKGDIWVSAFGRGFYWDNPSGDKGGYPFKLFPCASVDYGIMPFWDASFATEILSYGFNVPGNIKLKTKVTWPNNNKLRLVGVALSGTYMYNFLDKYASFGYRNSAIGFYPEGLMMSGSSLEWRAIGDVEFIQWKSYLPLKFYLNLGYRFSAETVPGRAYASVGGYTVEVLPDPQNYSQYLLFAGLEYKGLGTDFFIEYHMEILNSFKNLQTIRYFDANNYPKTFPYYFSENPMYFTPGLRIKYGNGINLMAAVPIKLSVEKGYALGAIPSSEQAKLQAQSKFWTDGFSPFYADWKIIGKISMPIRFTMSNAEMIRKFLLLKNRGKKQTMDIDQAIEKKDDKKEEGKSEEDKMKDDIEKRKKEMMKENLLE